MTRRSPEHGTHDISCPECSRKVDETVQWFLIHKQYTCPACGTVLSLDTSASDGAHRDLAAALEKLKHNRE